MLSFDCQCCPLGPTGVLSLDCQCCPLTASAAPWTHTNVLSFDYQCCPLTASAAPWTPTRCWPLTASAVPWLPVLTLDPPLGAGPWLNPPPPPHPPPNHCFPTLSLHFRNFRIVQCHPCTSVVSTASNDLFASRRVVGKVLLDPKLKVMVGNPKIKTRVGKGRLSGVNCMGFRLCTHRTLALLPAAALLF